MKTKRFNYTHMRKVFYSWHGGQCSPLYAAASSGLVADVKALQDELKACAASMWADNSNFRQFNYVDGKPTQSTMRAHVYKEYQYLLSVANQLPNIIKRQVTVNGGAYGALPWSNKQ